MASQRSLRGLDWFAFFVADIQTGWGPFVATYLTSVAWTQFEIGLILTIGTIAGLALQIPARAPLLRWRRLAPAPSCLHCGQFSAWWSLLKCCMRSQVHCSGLRLSR